MPLILFLFVFILLSVKASRIPFSPSELLIINHSGSLKEAIAFVRDSVSYPFVSVITTLSLGSQRLPEILAGTVSLSLFYLLLRKIRIPRPLLLTIVPAAGLLFLNFSYQIGTVIWLVTGTLALLYFSHLVFLEKKTADFWPVAALAALFLVLPTVDFTALYIIAILDIILLIFLLIRKRFIYLVYLAFFNLFATLHFVPWGDVVAKNYTQRFGVPAPGNLEHLIWFLLALGGVLIFSSLFRLIKRDPPQNLTPFLTALVLFAFSFVLRSIKANYFSLWSDGFITSRWDRMDRLLEYHHFDNNAPLPPVVNLFFKEVFHNNFFAQRFPHILVISLAVLVFYQMMVHFLKDRRWAFIFALVPATGYMFVYFSQEIRPYSYLLFFTLVSLYYSYRVIVKGENKWWLILILLLSFSALPLAHYGSWFHFLALDVALVIVSLLFAARKLASLLKLLFLNLFIIFAYIPWADSVYQYVSANLALRIDPLAHYRFTSRVFWEMLDKFSGASGSWRNILFAFFIGSAVYLVIRVIKRAIKKEEITSFDKFALLIVSYWPVFFFLLSRARYTEDIFFWRHYMFIVWPFYTLIFYGLYHLLKAAFKISLLTLLAKTLVIALIGFFLISNLINTTVYFLAPDRFFHWSAIVDFIEPMLATGQKEKIYTDNPGDLRPYLETQLPAERGQKILQAVVVVSRAHFYEKILPSDEGKSGKLVFIRIATTQEPPPVPIPGYNLKVFGKSPYLDFLMERGSAPYSDWYEIHALYY